MNCKEFGYAHLRAQESDLVDISKFAITEEQWDSEWDQSLTNDLPDRRWKRPVNRTDLINRFSSLYDILFSFDAESSRADTIMNDLFDILSQLSTYVIYDRIYSLKVYTRGDEEEIAQNGHVAAFETLLADLRRGVPRKDAVFYYLSIYKNKTRDYLNFYGLLKKKEDKANPQDPEAKKRSHAKADNRAKKPTVTSIRTASRIEDLAADSDGDIQMDRAPWIAVNPFEDDSDYQAENSRKILKIYLEQLLNNTNIPPAPLAVMYARVLYQMEKLLDADSVHVMVSQYMQKQNWSEDPDSPQYDQHIVHATQSVQENTTATAPDWAISRMKKMTVFELEKDSELTLHRLFDKTLFWGSAFREKSATVSDKFAPLLWGSIVYTDSYGKPQIENWAADVHNATVEKTARQIFEQKALLSYVMDELDENGRLKGAVRRKQQKAMKVGGVSR